MRGWRQIELQSSSVQLSAQCYLRTGTGSSLLYLCKLLILSALQHTAEVVCTCSSSQASYSSENRPRHPSLFSAGRQHSSTTVVVNDVMSADPTTALPLLNFIHCTTIVEHILRYTEWTLPVVLCYFFISIAGWLLPHIIITSSWKLPTCSLWLLD